MNTLDLNAYSVGSSVMYIRSVAAMDCGEEEQR